MNMYLLFLKDKECYLFDEIESAKISGGVIEYTEKNKRHHKENLYNIKMIILGKRVIYEK